jgi:hypothetical protein
MISRVLLFVSIFSDDGTNLESGAAPADMKE